MATPTSGSQAAQQNGTAKSGGRKRHVASQAGVTRYGKPIGSEIGGPRDANHAAIQQDQGARKNYGDLIGGDAAAQRKSLDGMSTEDLNKLADISFSFKSSDPKVVALRIAARNAQVRRGIHVKPGQTQTNPGGKAAPSVNYNNRGNAKALANLGPASAKLIELANAAKEKNTSSLGSFPIPDVNHLRKAMQAIGRAKPEHRPIIARHIIARAGKLNASHLVGDHIKHYARGARKPGSIGMARGESGAIELTGKWKHGYIPLDAEAVRVKMKGGKGKRWWGDSSVGGTSGSLKPHGSPKSGSPRHGGPVKNAHQPSAADKSAGRAARQQRVDEAARARSRAAAPKLAPKGSSERTTVVKSGSPKTEPRGAKVNDTYTRGHAGAKDGFDRGHRVSYTLNGKKHTGTITRIENGSGATVRRNRGEGAHDLVDRKNLTHVDTPEKQAHNAYLAADKGSPEKAKYAAETKAHFDARAKRDIAAGQERLKALGIDAHGNKVASKPAKTTPKMKELLAAGAKHPSGEVRVMNVKQGESLENQGLIKKTGATFHITDKGRAHIAGHTSSSSVKPTQSQTAAEIVRLRERQRADANNDARKAGLADRRKAEGSSGSSSPATLAKNYVQMHGDAGARRKIAQMEARKTLSAKDKTLLSALKAEVGGGSGKA